MHSVKRFISVFLLCVILPFILLQPLTSSADNGTFSVQGTEYQKPLFIVPDIDFDVFSHYFLCVYGSPRYPSYRLYAIAKDDVSEDCLRFSPALTSSDSMFYSYFYHSEHSVSTSYDYVRLYSFDTSTGLSSFEKIDLSISGWVFDGYSTFDASAGASSKYIIGSNCDIYDYSGNLLRAGDYDNLCSFFVGGLKGSSDKSQNPVPIETTTGSSSGGVSVDLSGISDYLSNILGSLSTLIDSIKSINVSVKIDANDILGEIKHLLSNIAESMVFFEDLKNYLDDKFQFLNTEISEFKNSFLEFVTVGADIKKLPSLFGDIGLQFSSLINDLNDTLDGISAYFGDDNIIGDIKGNIATLRSNTETIINYLLSIKDNVSSIKSVDFKVEFDNFFNALNVGFAGLLASLGDIKGVIDGISAEIGDIKLSIGDIKNSVNNNFSELMSLIRSESQSIRNTINSLPESFRTLLKELFIPKEDHFSGFDDIKKHFEFVNQILKIGDAIVDSAKFYKKPPVFNFNFSHELFGEFSVKLDFGIIPYKYVVFVRNFIRGVTLIFFVRRTRKRLPDVINGCGG